MKRLPELFEKNRAWAARMVHSRPNFFKELAAEQAPRFLWIGCSDSRVAATEICGIAPGEMFVHRNIANVVVHTDVNCLSVLQYAVDVLQVTDVIVCGHYGCGGVAAALQGKRYGLIDCWLHNIKDVYARNYDELRGLSTTERHNRLCELNVGAQVANLCYTSIVQEAWARGQNLTVHGWIYGLSNGLLKDLQLCIEGPGQIGEVYVMEKV